MGMNRAMRMLMLTDGRGERDTYEDYDDMSMRGGRNGTRNYDIDIYTDRRMGNDNMYPTEMRRGGGRGRMSYRPDAVYDEYGHDMGYDPYETGVYGRISGEPEMRRGRDSRGRFTRMGYDDETEMRMGGYSEDRMMDYKGYPEPIYRDGRMSMHEEYPRMNAIGFERGNYGMPEEFNPHYRSDATYPRMEEVGYMKGKEPMMGGAKSKAKGGKLNKEMVDDWMEMLENSIDGSSGPHWDREQVKHLAEKLNIKYDKFSADTFYALVNAQYADLGKVAKKMNVATPEFFGEAAKAWLCDEDFDGTPEEKAYLYFTEIVMH